MKIVGEGLSEGPKIIGGNASWKSNNLDKLEIGS